MKSKRAATSDEVANVMNKRIKSKSRRKKGREYSLPSWKGVPAQPHLNVDRVKRRLAFLVVQGKRNSYIKRELGITQKTLDQYLNHPTIQESISNMEQEVYTAAERAYASLFVDSVEEMGKILKGATEVPDKLQAIEMLWKAQGRLLTGKAAEINIANQNTNGAVAAGAIPIDRDDAGNILQLLQAMKKKETMELETISGSEG